MIKVLFAALSFVFLSSAVSAQNWGGGVDSETLHFGFTFQYLSSEFRILKKQDWREPFYDEETSSFATDSLYSISSPASPGFGLGFVSDLKLTEHVNLRFTPGLVFTDRLLDYNYAPQLPVPIPANTIDPNNVIVVPSDSYTQKKVQATMVDLPVGIKLKSDRIMNYRAYLIGGIKYSMDIISKKKTDDTGFAPLEKLVKNKRSILSYEVGVGLDLYFEFFKLSPEIKLSNSFNSVLTPEEHAFSSPLEKLFLRNFQFSLYFE